LVELFGVPVLVLFYVVRLRHNRLTITTATNKHYSNTGIIHSKVYSVTSTCIVVCWTNLYPWSHTWECTYFKVVATHSFQFCWFCYHV